MSQDSSPTVAASSDSHDGRVRPGVQSGLRVAAVQHDIVWEQPEATFSLVAPLIDAAAAGGADLIVLTEMFSTGFSMNADAIAESPDGPSAQFLLAQAQAHSTLVAGSIPTRMDPDALPVNRLIIAGPDGIVAEYHKIHPFSYAGEDKHYQAGTEFTRITINGVRCTLFICYDLRFADEFWVNAADTDVYLVVANWPSSRSLHWRTLLTARAIENQAYVVGTNRVGWSGYPGDDSRLDYQGDSMIIDPLGHVLGHASHDPAVLAAEIDPARVSAVRRQFPFAQDRR